MTNKLKKEIEIKINPIKTIDKLLIELDKRMKSFLIDKKKALNKDNLSEALICDDYFFALFFLKERILAKDLNVHSERNRLLK